MTELTLAWQGQSIRILCPETLRADIAILFGGLLAPDAAPTRSFRITEDQGRFALYDDAGQGVAGLSRGDLVSSLMDAVITAFISDVAQGVVLHAGAVARNGRAVLVAGASGAGKSSLICWLVEQGFDYLTDEIVLLQPADGTITPLPRATVVKPGSKEPILGMRAFRDARRVVAGTHVMVEPPAASPGRRPSRASPASPACSAPPTTRPRKFSAAFASRRWEPASFTWITSRPSAPRCCAENASSSATTPAAPTR